MPGYLLRLKMKRKGKVNSMKKTILVIAIVAIVLVAAMTGCRAVERVPGVSAAQSMMPTLPGVSPSPAYTETTAYPMATPTLGGVTAGANTTP